MTLLTVRAQLPLIEPLRRRSERRYATRIMMLATILASSLTTTNRADAQVVPNYGQFQPLNQYLPPGLAGQWSAMAGKGANWAQPIRIILDGEGDVSVYHSRPVQAATLPSPAQLGVHVGHLYRLRISNMPDLPGVELFPTIEILDRLHPPTGQKHDFPIPIYLARDDVDSALDGNLVTRVVYVEQPQLAAPFELDDSTRVRTLLPAQNVLEQADRYGRPVVIVRIGGRQPSMHGELPTFYGTGGFVSESRPSPPPTVDAAAINPDQPAELKSSSPLNRGTAE